MHELEYCSRLEGSLDDWRYFWRLHVEIVESDKEPLHEGMTVSRSHDSPRSTHHLVRRIQAREFTQYPSGKRTSNVTGPTDTQFQPIVSGRE